MLEFVQYQNYQEKFNTLKNNFDPSRSTWIVPDLKSKSEIQKVLLEKYGFLEEDSVLRASELWGKLQKQLILS